MEKKRNVGSTLKAVVDRIFVERRLRAHSEHWQTFADRLLYTPYLSVDFSQNQISNRYLRIGGSFAMRIGGNVKMRKPGNFGLRKGERFDRHFIEGVSTGWARHQYASARSVFYAKPAVQRYSFTGSYQRLSLELASWSNKTAIDRVELFKRSVLNCLINNLDDHDLNTGFINSVSGFQLSPLFDVVPQRPAGARSRLALNVGTFGAEAT